LVDLGAVGILDIKITNPSLGGGSGQPPADLSGCHVFLGSRLYAVIENRSMRKSSSLRGNDKNISLDQGVVIDSSITTLIILSGPS
jgi:hypothetical protein